LGDGISADGDESRSGESEIYSDRQRHATDAAHGFFFKSFTKVYGGSEAAEIRRDQATEQHRTDRSIPPKSTAERQVLVLDKSDLNPNLPDQSPRTEDLGDSSTVPAELETVAQSRYSDRVDHISVDCESSGRTADVPSRGEAVSVENAPRLIGNPAPARSSDARGSVWLLLRNREASGAISASEHAVDAAGIAGADRAPNSARSIKIGKEKLLTLAFGVLLLASVYVGFSGAPIDTVRTSEPSDIIIAEADPLTGVSRSVPELSAPPNEVPVRLVTGALISPRQSIENLATVSLSIPPDAFALGGRADPAAIALPRPISRSEQPLTQAKPDDSGPAPGAAEATENDLALSNRDRVLLQRKLWLLGYDPQGVDGIFGPKSRAAISGWQDAQGLPATGYLDGEQIAQINGTSGELYARWIASRSKQSETSASGSGQAPEKEGARGDDRDGSRDDESSRHDDDRSFSAVMDNARRDFGRVTSKAAEVLGGLWD
jgi:hypothetical protein